MPPMDAFAPGSTLKNRPVSRSASFTSFRVMPGSTVISIFSGQYAVSYSSEKNRLLGCCHPPLSAPQARCPCPNRPSERQSGHRFQQCAEPHLCCGIGHRSRWHQIKMAFRTAMDFTIRTDVVKRSPNSWRKAWVAFCLIIASSDIS